MMFWPDQHMEPWAFAAMSLYMLVFWGLLVVGVVMLVRYLSRGGLAIHDVKAERILAERFARGEIDEQEYRQRMAVLRSPGSP